MIPLGGPVLTAAEMRAAEAASGVALDVLMERAGAALAEAVWRFGGGQPVLVLCGPGNNGGDGYVAARLLAERGLPVRLAASAPPATELARNAAAAWRRDVEDVIGAEPAPVIVDALFGTGLSRPLTAELRASLHRLVSSATLTIAADLPSGVGTDDGGDLGMARADITLGFAAAKPAHLLQPSAAGCGRVLIADIGCPVASRTEVLRRPVLAAPGPADHKYTRGMVAVVPGEMAGAASLGVTAAARIAGYTVFCGKGDAPHSVVRRGFEKMLADPKLGGLLIGPGLADTTENRARLDAALASPLPLILDAGALGLVTSMRLRRHAATIVTPHEGEFGRLFGERTGSKLERARQAAAESGAVVILKGSDTVIASPDGRAAIAPMASPWLATAGTGDVLAGIASGLLARLHDPHDAACAAVWLHAEAARRAGPALIADDLAAHLPAALAACAR